MKSKVKPGDVIVLYHMDDEMMSPGTKGTVLRITRDPFEDDNKIIEVLWENGSTLSLMSKYDVWKVLENQPITENVRGQSDFIRHSEDVFRNFDVKAIREFLMDLRDSGITNMFGSSPLLYSGSDYIVQRFGSPYDIEFQDDKNFEAYERVILNADAIKNKVINGVMKSLESRDEDFDIDLVNREVQKASKKLLNMYMVFF